MVPQLVGRSIAGSSVFPDFGAVGGRGDLASLAGGLMTVVLIMAVLMLIVSGVGWAVSSSSGNLQAATRARLGVWVSIGTAALAGVGVTWLNFLLDAGRHL